MFVRDLLIYFLSESNYFIMLKACAFSHCCIHTLQCRPALQLPGANKPIVAVRFCPITFGLRGSKSGVDSRLHFSKFTI